MTPDALFLLIAMIFSAFFSGMEIAFVSSSKLRFEVDRSNRTLSGKLLSVFYDNPDNYISTMLVGNNIALVVYGIMMSRIIDGFLIAHITNNPALLLLTDTIISTLIILAVTSNVVLSLGMVGALSIVRFRTAIKEPLDIAFLFWSIAVGIVLAAGMIPLAVIGSVVIGVILLVFVNKKSYSNPYIIMVSCADHDAEVRVKDYLAKETNRAVVKSKTAKKGIVELNIEIRLKSDNTDFVNVISDMDGVNSAVLVSYNGEYMG